MEETAVNRIVQLLLVQQNGAITGEEQQELDAWTASSGTNRQFIDRCLNLEQVAASLEQVDKIDEEGAWRLWIEKNGLNNTAVVVPMNRPKVWRWVAAAIAIGVLATASFLYLNKGPKKPEQALVKVDKGEHIQPGTNKATLTLSDGRIITLDEEKEGTLAREGGAAVSKKGDGLIYSPDEAGNKKGEEKAPVTYNTVSTPRGGFYALTLPDKSKVWLNADASIRFPTVFTGKERRVAITGEAYFEVAKKADQPFIVTVSDAQVKVLGTHFNIRSYVEDGATRTTLLEGSVQVQVAANTGKGQAASAILTPGQQAVSGVATSTGKSSPVIVRTVDVESVVAWKNGYFDFKATSLADILKEIKRWYHDIEAIDIRMRADETFTASIPRNVPLSTMLTILESTDRVHFEMRGKTIVVKPKVVD